jgi:hypothetical protein
VHLEHEISAHNISCLGGPRAVFIKKCARTHYVELVFLHPVGSVSHVVHFGASRA